MRFATLIAATAIILAACGGSTAAPVASGQAKPAAGTSTVAKPEKDHIKLAYATQSGEQTFMILAADKGMFQKYGLTVEPAYAQGNSGLAALSSGEAQMDMADGVTA